MPGFCEKTATYVRGGSPPEFGDSTGRATIFRYVSSRLPAKFESGSDSRPAQYLKARRPPLIIGTGLGANDSVPGGGSSSSAESEAEKAARSSAPAAANFIAPPAGIFRAENSLPASSLTSSLSISHSSPLAASTSPEPAELISTLERSARTAIVSNCAGVRERSQPRARCCAFVQSTLPDSRQLSSGQIGNTAVSGENVSPAEGTMPA